MEDVEFMVLGIILVCFVVWRLFIVDNDCDFEIDFKRGVLGSFDKVLNFWEVFIVVVFNGEMSGVV